MVISRIERKNMKKVLLLAIFPVIIISSCFGMDVMKEILKDQNDWFYINENEKNDRHKMGITYTIKIYSQEKGINFGCNKEEGLLGEDIGLIYDKVVTDEKKKTISFYRKDNRLIITIEILNDKKDIKIIDYGKWLTWEEKYESASAEESHVRFRFDQLNFKDSSRVYQYYD
jgi:hypothetical protein